MGLRLQHKSWCLTNITGEVETIFLPKQKQGEGRDTSGDVVHVLLAGPLLNVGAQRREVQRGSLAKACEGTLLTAEIHALEKYAGEA